MKFELNCMATDLKQALAIAATVTDSGVKVPVLKCVRIEVADGTATFIATNTDHAMRSKTGADGEGIIHADIALLAQKAAALRQDKPVRIVGETDDMFVTVTQDKTRWRLPLIYGDGFPYEFTNAIPGEPVSIRRDALFAAISAVQAIINPLDPHSTIGKGVYLDMSQSFHVVGCARRGLSVVEIDQPKLPVSIIIPTDAIRAITQIFRDPDILDIVATADGITVSAGSVMYKSKLIEGQYVDWRVARDVQSKGLDANAIVYIEHFTDAITRATAIAEDKMKGGTIDGTRFTFADNECAISIKNKSGEEGFDTCEYEGDSGNFGVSASLISSAIASLFGTKVSLQFRSEPGNDVGAIIVRPEPPSTKDNYRVVMGMLVS